MGMGSSLFWIEEIIASTCIMPTQEAFLDETASGSGWQRRTIAPLRRELGPLLYFPPDPPLGEADKAEFAMDAFWAAVPWRASAPSATTHGFLDRALSQMLFDY